MLLKIWSVNCLGSDKLYYGLLVDKIACNFVSCKHEEKVRKLASKHELYSPLKQTGQGMHNATKMDKHSFIVYDSYPQKPRYPCVK